MNHYPGGKNRSGVYQQIISMIPPTDTFVEGFFGSGAITRRMLPALIRSIGYEIDPAVVAKIERADHWPESFTLKNESFFDALPIFAASSVFWGWNDPARTVIYLDPPYLGEVRSSKRKIYKFEMMSPEAHARLLNGILAMPCRVMISGYDSDQYNAALQGWRKETIPTTNRAGTRVFEQVWLNFPKPRKLHDYGHLGTDFHDRDRIKKKARRWVRMLHDMPDHERYAVSEHVAQYLAEQEKAEAAENRRFQKRILKAARRFEANPLPCDTAALFPLPDHEPAPEYRQATIDDIIAEKSK